MIVGSAFLPKEQFFHMLQFCTPDTINHAKGQSFSWGLFVTLHTRLPIRPLQHLLAHVYTPNMGSLQRHVTIPPEVLHKFSWLKYREWISRSTVQPLAQAVVVSADASMVG